jgi:hypothetical protein
MTAVTFDRTKVSKFSADEEKSIFDAFSKQSDILKDELMTKNTGEVNSNNHFDEGFHLEMMNQYA